MHRAFDLLLFHRAVETSTMYLNAGVDGVVVDLETSSKSARQRGFDTEINNHTIADLRALRGATNQHLLCRVTGPDVSEAELWAVIEAGADEIIVPMLTSEKQAERICHLIQDACDITLMIETREAVLASQQICQLPVARIYVGFNDLRISRRTPTIFAPMADGLLAKLRPPSDGPYFGFGGLTLPGKGSPLPVSHLYNAMAQYGAGFTFLRRSFYQDVQGVPTERALHNIRSEIAAARSRTTSQIDADHIAMVTAVNALNGVTAVG